MTLDYLALGILIAVALILFYGIIALADLPYQIAKRRGHPHQDAIQVAGWVSLFTLHAIWPLLWIWATLYRPDRAPVTASEAVPPTAVPAMRPVLASERSEAKGG